MTDEEKNQLIVIRLRKSEESYTVAEEILSDHPTFSINRYYYALYYAVSAVLLNAGVETKTHKGIITAFNKGFVKTNDFSKEEGKLLVKVFQWRTRGDYDDNEDFTTADVETIRQPVRDLLDKLSLHLGQ